MIQLHTDPADYILDDFLSEELQDRATLDRYLRLHPEHANALLDLFAEIKAQAPSSGDVSQTDAAWIEKATLALRVRLSVAAADPFSRLTQTDYGALRRRLGVRAATLTGFRDRRVDLASVPGRILRELAEGLDATVEVLIVYLSQPPRLAVQSYRADRAPHAGAKVSFEVLLKSANEPPEVQERLLSQSDP